MKRRIMHIISLLFVLTITSSCFFSSEQDNPYDPANVKDKVITNFQFIATQNEVADLKTDAIGLISGTSIDVTVPYGTKVAELVATFVTNGESIKVGLDPQISGETKNNFTNTVIYTVIGADGYTRDYTVTVTVAANTAKDITAFSFTTDLNSGSGVTFDSSGTVSETDISVVVPNGTDPGSLVATFSVTGQSVSVNGAAQVSGVTVNDFSAPVIYTVKAADNSTKSYTVTVVRDTAKWANTVTDGSGWSFFNSTAIDSEGNVYAAGWINGQSTYTFGEGVSVAGSNTGSNVVLVKYDSGGVAQWAKTVSTGFGNSSFSSVAVDSEGNVYAAGTIIATSQYTFGTDVNVTGSNTNASVVLVKYDSYGNAKWARTVSTGEYGSYFTSVSVDSNGNVYAAGYIRGNSLYTFGTGVSAAGNEVETNVVLVKYDTNGVAKWARTVSTGESKSEFTSVAVDSTGDVYAAGSIYGRSEYYFSTDVTAAGTGENENIVLVKYDKDGVAQWARTVIEGGYGSNFNSVSVDSNGNVYAAGSIYGISQYIFGTDVTVTGTNSTVNILLVKYDKDGVAQWARTVIEGKSNSLFNSVSVDSNGNVYAAGYMHNSSIYKFGAGVIAAGSCDFRNILLVKYNTDGVAQWARTESVGGVIESEFRSVAVDSYGNVYAAGYILGIIDEELIYSFGFEITATAVFEDHNCVLVKY